MLVKTELSKDRQDLWLSICETFHLKTYLWRGPTLGQAQLKMILHSSEEILETFSSTIQEALKQRLLNTQIRACMCK